MPAGSPVELVVSGASDRVDTTGGDVALRAVDVHPQTEWIEKLRDIVHSLPRVACVTVGIAEEAEAALLAQLPLATPVHTAEIGCAYFSHAALELLGGFDATQSDLDAWCSRAKELGFQVLRANRIAARGTKTASAECGLDGALAQRALGLRAKRPLKVALDLRGVPPESVGTKIYARELGRALSKRRDIELSVIAQRPDQAEGIAVLGSVIVLLNNDTCVVADDWIEWMLMHAQQPAIGCVGALLLYADDSIQHAGVVLGVRGVASNAFAGAPRRHRGYFGSVQAFGAFEK